MCIGSVARIRSNIAFALFHYLWILPVNADIRAYTYIDKVFEEVHTENPSCDKGSDFRFLVTSTCTDSGGMMEIRRNETRIQIPSSGVPAKTCTYKIPKVKRKNKKFEQNNCFFLRQECFMFSFFMFFHAEN
jgi:hypothetical protein